MFLFYKLKDISFYDFEFVLNAQKRSSFFYESYTEGISFNQGQIRSAPGSQFITDAAGAPEDITGSDVFQVHHVFQRVKQTLFGNVRSRARRNPCRRIKPSSFKQSTYNTH